MQTLIGGALPFGLLVQPTVLAKWPSAVLAESSPRSSLLVMKRAPTRGGKGKVGIFEASSHSKLKNQWRETAVAVKPRRLEHGVSPTMQNPLAAAPNNQKVQSRIPAGLYPALVLVSAMRRMQRAEGARSAVR